jgi:hypothetical protein
VLDLDSITDILGITELHILNYVIEDQHLILDSERVKCGNALLMNRGHVPWLYSVSNQIIVL